MRPGPSRLLIGTHTFAARGDGARRQDAGLASLRALRDAEVVNVQFAAEPHDAPGVETLAHLQQTSNGVSGRSGPLKPVMSEIFDVLALEARRRGLAYFCFTNGDILFSQDAVDWMLDGDRDGYVLSREDFDAATGESLGMQIAGTDVFAIATAWWPLHRHRFRAYIAGEGGWDNVYTAVMLVHGNGIIENHRPLVRHEEHARSAMASPYFGMYINYLAALDTWYFDRWCKYWDGLVRLRREGAPLADEHALRDAVFRWPPRTAERMLQAARTTKAVIRYGAWKLRHGESG